MQAGSQDQKRGPLSSDLDDPTAIPYFLWDERMTVAELQTRLRTSPPPEKARLLGKILREARDTDVWRFTSPAEVLQLWSELSRYLGRRRPFWEFLLRQWRAGTSGIGRTSPESPARLASPTAPDRLR
jgi:hypothetical protein